MSAKTTLRTVLAVAAAVAMPAMLGVRAAAVPAGAAQSQASASDRAKFVGTYSLVLTEAKDDAGKWAPTRNFNSIGFITYADTGHMGVHIMPRVRARFTSNQPTPEEAQAALRGYTAYFGTFSVNDKEKLVTHHRAGHLDAGAPDFRRYYDFVPDPRNPSGGFERLILTPQPANGGKEQARSRLIWERMPMAPLSAEEKKFVGFHKLLYTDSYRMKDGKEVFHGNKNEARAGSYIIYTPSGHMMVHLMDRTGPIRTAGGPRTPEAALKAYRGFTGYFGRFVTYENQTPRFVFHSQLGSTNPGRYSDQKRFYEFTGNVLRLGGPPSLNAAGELAGGHLYWERMPPVK
jgi:hypothetical protein